MAYEVEPMLVVFGVALIIGGWVQQQVFHGFSVGLEQLFEIRKNTSNNLPATDRQMLLINRLKEIDNY